MTTSTAAAKGWGCSVIEAAAWGVPCVALNAPGTCHSVLYGHTGWLVERPQDFGAALITALAELTDENRTQKMTTACQEWARCFSWDRSAELLASVLLTQASVVTSRHVGFTERRYARSDIGTLARFSSSRSGDLRAVLRSTDEIAEHGEMTSMLLRGCDEFDAAAVLHRLGVFGEESRLIGRHDLLAGPAAASVPVSGDGFSSAQRA